MTLLPLGFTGVIFMFVWWIFIIFGAIALIRWLIKQPNGLGADYSKTPVEILKERYAKGEIDKKEFETKKKDLL